MRKFTRFLPSATIAAAAAAAIVLAIPIVVRTIVAPHLHDAGSPLRTAQGAILLGASVSRGEPSAILAERADTAIALYENGVVKKILISGDNGERSYDEVSVMLAYLLRHGVPARDIFLDRAGFDTYSSMFRARHIFGVRTLIVVTQDFHLPRAVFLARAMGIDAEGYLAGAGGTGWDYLREIPATAKAVFDLLVHRQPKYLGAPIPLAGRGNAL